MYETASMNLSTVDRAVAFHGDLCPGVAGGIQAARLALGRLGVTADDASNLVAIVEHNRCAADGVQVVTGCTFGKANLIHRDWGKQAITLIDRTRNRAVRIAPRPDARPDPSEPEWWDLAAKVGAGSASDAEAARFQALMQERAERILAALPEELYVAQDVAAEPPPKPWISPPVQCAACGEPVAPTHVRRLGGRQLCIPCALAAERAREDIRERYATAARAVETLDAKAVCCGPAPGGEAACCAGPVEIDFGPSLYSAAERDELPAPAVLASLGCGNPIAVAALAPGETVLDLGSGGGIDVILSARRVGPTGCAYGLDMTDEMLALARRNAAEAGVDNVEFLKGDIEDVPLPDASVDVVISNCVINLSADKRRVLAEAFRVLKPGGASR
jgi:formylmethanofuran dehydrogenase subunit E/2-polyprenyl-3-methyl-5-hydroxy-6-metoxy-1,4-benzoquinol methylase